MSMTEKRVRALDRVEQGHHPWQRFSSIFGQLVTIVDVIFNRGHDSGEQLYVENKDKFEEAFCRVSVNPVRNVIINDKPSHSTCVLRGQVGRGKSTLVRHCIQVTMPELFGKDALIQVYIDCVNYDDQSPLQSFNRAFCLELECWLLKHLSWTEKELWTEFVGSRGLEPAGDAELISIYSKLLNMESIMTFIDHLIECRILNVKGIVFYLDNADENPPTVVKAVSIFAQNICRTADSRLKQVPLTVVVCLREYNAVGYENTNRHTLTDMRGVDECAVIQTKLKVLHSEIVRLLGTSLETMRAAYGEPVEIMFDYNLPGGAKDQTRKFIIEPGGIPYFLEQVIAALFHVRDPLAMSFLQRMAAGNLKVLGANVFNLLLSKKLPRSSVFTSSLLASAGRPRQFSEAFDITTILECMLAVHYPFYTRRESFVANLFNVNGSSAIGEYKDLLILPRVLLYLKNSGSKTPKEIIGFFNTYGYDNELVKNALERAFSKGMFNTMFGVRLSHLRHGKWRISLSSVGLAYLEDIMSNLIYYQYVCEDTYMPESLVVDLMAKYPADQVHRGDKEARVQSGLNMLEYIVLLERAELEQLRTYNSDVNKYLLMAGFQVNGKGVKLEDHLKPIMNEARTLLKKFSAHG